MSRSGLSSLDYDVLLARVGRLERELGHPCWYASGGDIARSGPYNTQRGAWDSMRVTADIAEKTQCPYPLDVLVWPEWPEWPDE